MIEVEREETAIPQEGPWKHQRWRWRVRGRPEIQGVSREPLLAACRALKSLGADPQTEIALFRPGRSIWDLRTTVGYGASRTVRDNDRGTVVVKHTPFPSRDAQD